MSNTSTTSNGRARAWRSRWAAVGAAVAVTLGAGGMVAVNAAPSEPSSVITVEPTRILDTRTDVGLNSPPASGNSQKLQVTGTVPTQPPGGAAPVNAEVVPAGATAVVLNATVVRPTTKGFLSIRPGDATGNPATSNINWAADGPNIANSVTVQLPASGQIDIFVNGTASEVLLDVAGYFIDTALEDLDNRVAVLEAEQSFAVVATATDPLSLTTTPVPYLEVQIAAPVDGHVTVNYSTYISNATLGAESVCNVYPSTDLPASISFSHPGVGAWETGSTTNGDEGSVSGTNRFEISAQETVAYWLACEELGGSGSVWGRAMTAIFTPAP